MRKREGKGCWEKPIEHKTKQLITAELLKAVNPFMPKNADVFVPYLNETCYRYDITTVERLTMFIAQLAHESGGFRYVREIASGKAYDTGRLSKILGNTPEADGDGQFYKGRGLMQITGRDNYRKASYEMFGDDRLLRHPELLETPSYASYVAGWYWNDRKLNKWADKDDMLKVTKLINGGYNGLDDRKRYYARAVKFFQDNPIAA